MVTWAKWTLICFALFLVAVSGQSMSSEPYKVSSICQGLIICKNLKDLEQVKDCVVIVGSLMVVTMENSTVTDFAYIKFDKLKEITGYLVVYRVNALESVSQLFPNLARIRGEELLYDYALVVYDMPALIEVGLYDLVKIDHGGVIVLLAPQACYVDTIDWKTLVPRSRHVFGPTDKGSRCKPLCSCSDIAAYNYCWNNRKCQRFPEAEKCNEQCLGCRKTNLSECFVCRQFTYNWTCVSHCPEGTLVFTRNQYCMSEQDCLELGGWAWNKTCVSACPDKYNEVEFTVNNITKKTCKLCPRCAETCNSLVLKSISSLTSAKKCVFINGSLVIHLASNPDAMDELRYHLSQVQYISDYVEIYSSFTITSLDFLSSLRLIGGRNLQKDRYSLMIYDMGNLQTLFTVNVTKSLIIARGTMMAYNNPELCMNQIDKLKERFKEEPDELDLPPGRNGYNGGCTELSVDLQIRVVNETSAWIMFYSSYDSEIYYSILYVRLPIEVHKVKAPYVCSQFEWDSVHVRTRFGHPNLVLLTSLQPASTYAICIETYDPRSKNLARSEIFNFSTPVGKPEPPFIFELVAASPYAVVLHWVDHEDYRKHITHYELDVKLIHIYQNLSTRNYCNDIVENDHKLDYSRHAIVLKPPPKYTKGCKSMCGILSSVADGAITEEPFHVCSNTKYDGLKEPRISENLTFHGFVQSISLNIKSPKYQYQVGGLAPYRDYSFKLKACAKAICSRATKETVKTLPLKYVDKPSIVFIEANSTGYITIQWESNHVTNGPLLAHFVEISPNVKLSNVGTLMPQVWCVSPNVYKHTVRSVISRIYFVRVCSTTFASKRACSDWENIIPYKTSSSWLWSGVVIGVLVWIISIAISYILKRRYVGDKIPLVNRFINYRIESEPPSSMVPDFVPFYTIPLCDSTD